VDSQSPNGVKMDEQIDRSREPDLEQLNQVYGALKKRPAEALSKLVHWAEKGSLMSMVYLGYAYQDGRGVPINFLTAEQWYRRAVDGGLMRACCDLGSLYLERRRYAEAQAIFEVAAAKNFTPAIHRLGRMYFYGHGIDKNLERAKTLLERASADGNIAAKMQLAHLLKSGHFGMRQRIWGMWISFTAFIECMAVYQKEGPRSERFL
jgi:TPR repeat protein